MSDEEMDDIIRKAVDQHHPPYNDEAWSKMEQLLDKHLPQKKDRRLYPVIILVAVVGLLFFGYRYFSGSLNRVAPGKEQVVSRGQGNTPAASEHPSQRATPSPNTAVPAGTESQIAAKTATTFSRSKGQNTFISSQKTTPARTRITVRSGEVTTAETEPGSNKTTTGKTTGQPVDNSLAVNGRTPETAKTTAVSNNNGGSADDIATNNDVAKTVTSITPAVTGSNKRVTDSAKMTTKKETPIVAKTAGTKKAVNNLKSFANNFAFTLSIGPDIAYVGKLSNGKLSSSYGAGLKYSIGRFSIASGFYVSRKLYAADSADYHAPAIFTYYYPNIQKIEANCLVYEIPLSVYYTFKRTAKGGFFGGTGLSTYLMKEETYKYFYKNPAGASVNKSYSLYGANKHFFSVLTLTAGYERNLNKRVSVSVAPYFKMPLGGVGYGKVKLNALGAMITASVRPFAK